MNEPIPGDDLGTEFLSEADLPSTPPHALPPAANRGIADSPSRESHANTTARLIEIVQADPLLAKRPDSSPTRSTAARPRRTQRTADRAILLVLQLLVLSASAAAAAWFVLVGVARRMHRIVLLAGACARRVTAALRRLAGLTGRLDVRNRLQMLVTVGSRLSVHMRRAIASGLQMGQRAARTGYSRIGWPAIPSVAAAFVGGVAVGATAMWVAPNAARDSAVVEPRGNLDAELEMTSSGGAVRGTTGTPTLASAPVATQGIVQLAALTRAADRGPHVANASEKLATSKREVGARPEAAAPQRRLFRGSLTVRSHPAGASVFVNGSPVGKTPLVLTNQTVGSRSIRITLDGHEVWSTGARVVAYQQSIVEANLRQLPAEPPARQ